MKNLALGIRDALETVIRSRVASFGLALLAVIVGVIALLKSPVAAAVVIAALVVAFTVVAVYGLVLRNRFGGLWEIIEDTDEWDIQDGKGSLVHLTKTRKLRFLQNGVFAIRDYAWGDGEFEGGYSCDPGFAADHFTYQGRHNVIVSLRETKQRGDVGVYVIRREFVDSFCNDSESVHAEILTTTRQLIIKVLFPQERVPNNAWATSKAASVANKKPTLLAVHGDAGGRQFVTHTLNRPKLGEEYIVGWNW